VKYEIDLEILPQPDDASCGPTCLHAVYRYFGDTLPLESVVREVTPLESGGTLAVHLARHALARGYACTIYTYNLELFDPTWFAVPGVDLAERLRAQVAAKDRRKLRLSSEAYLDYLGRGGRIRFEELAPPLIARHLERAEPLLTGLSATYLYGCAREVGDRTLRYDDVRGTPTGHFVVLCGYDPTTRTVRVADPTADNPRFREHAYTVSIDRLLGAIMLGVITYDANLLVLEPARRSGGPA
jgi:hypothetical protein